MNTTSPSLTDQLEQFGDAQLSGVSMHDIHNSTVQLILTTVFFTGAAIGMAKQSNTAKKIYLSTLHIFLENHLGLNSEKAAGMIKSNARLYKRYVLIEKIYKAGWKAAGNWNQQTDDKNGELKSLLKKYQNLSMTDLSLEGTKEQKVVPPEVAPVEPSIPTKVIIAPPSTHWRRTVLLLILLAEVIGVAYLSLFTDLLTVLIPVLESTLGQLSELLSTQSLDKLIDKIVSLLP